MPAPSPAKRRSTRPAPRKRNAARKRGKGRRGNVKRTASKSAAETRAVKPKRERGRIAELEARLRRRLDARREAKAVAKVDASGEGPGRWQRRAAIAAVKLGATVAIAWGLLVVSREVYEYATTSPRFEVQHFIYEPTSHVDDETLRELMAIAPGTNILACDLAVLGEAIVAHPWVASATVTRNMPDTLQISVVEHEAAAIVLAGDFYLVNREGQPFKAVDRGERGELPIITGVERDELSAAAAASSEGTSEGGGESPALAEALALIELYAGKQRPRLGEVHLDEDGSVILYTATAGTALHLGREDFGARLERWDALRVALGDRADRLAVVHLDHESRPDRRDRVVARFASERDEVVLLAQAASAQQRPQAEVEAAGAKPEPERLPARASGRRNRIPSYE